MAHQVSLKAARRDNVDSIGELLMPATIPSGLSNIDLVHTGESNGRITHAAHIDLPNH